MKPCNWRQLEFSGWIPVPDACCYCFGPASLRSVQFTTKNQFDFKVKYKLNVDYLASIYKLKKAGFGGGGGEGVLAFTWIFACPGPAVVCATFLVASALAVVPALIVGSWPLTEASPSAGGTATRLRLCKTGWMVLMSKDSAGRCWCSFQFVLLDSTINKSLLLSVNVGYPVFACAHSRDSTYDIMQL